MKAIYKEIQVGSKDVELFVEAKIDGKVVISKKADSLVNSFLQTLYSMMANVDMPDSIFIDSDGFDLEDNAFQNITSIDNTSPGNVRINHSGGTQYSTADYVAVFGVSGYDAINGVHAATYIGNGVHEIDLPRNDAALTLTNAQIVRMKRSSPDLGNGVRSNTEAFFQPYIRLGTGTTAVNINDRGLKNMIGRGTGARQLTVGTVSVSLPAVGLSTSEITISRDFTNNSGADIAFTEVGLFQKGYSASFDHRFHLMARDVIAAVTIPNGKTVTVSYRIRTSVTDDDGIPVQFNEILYRQITGLSRESKTVDNVNSVDDDSSGQFLTVNCGGDNSVYTAISDPGNKYGPQIGSSTKIVEITDIRLQDGGGNHTRFPHGRGTDEVLHYGTFIEDWTVDPGAANEAYFHIYKMFENVSGADITINEVGLYCGGTTFTRPTNSHCFSRNRLAVPIILSNNEVLKVVYKIKLVA